MMVVFFLPTVKIYNPNYQNPANRLYKIEYTFYNTDTGWPGIDGLEVCRRLRAGGLVPIIILTAKDTVNDRIQGLDMGADDYMVKPFNLDELLARIRALLRRAQPSRPQILRFADLVLDTGTRQASRGDRVISLTAKEYELLELFLRHPRQVLTRDMIFDRVWGYDFGGETTKNRTAIMWLTRNTVGHSSAIRVITSEKKAASRSSGGSLRKLTALAGMA